MTDIRKVGMMKQTLGVLLASMLCSSAAYAKTYSQKTFLALKGQGVNTAMEYTTWHDHVYSGLPNRAPSKGLHSSFQATGFYQGSTNEGDLGKYFGVGNGKNTFKIGRIDGTGSLPAGTDVDTNFLIHDSTNAAGTAGATPAGATVTFSPEQELWGVRLDYFQDINHPYQHWFFKASLPIVYVDNNIEAKFTDQVNVSLGTAAAPAGTSGDTLSLQDFFAGNIDEKFGTGDPDSLQSPLTKAKINGRRSKTGPADLDFALGYKFLYTEKNHAFFNVGMTIPTGNRVRGEYVFEPVYGNGRHVGLGAGIDAGSEIGRWGKSCAHLLFAINYRYLFEGTEARTVGLKSESFPALMTRLNQYVMVGKAEQKDQPLIPAANILTQDLRVKPGSQFDAMLDLVFKSSGFVIDVGYSLFYKDAENVWVKGWQDGVYGIANRDYVTTASFTLNTEAINGKAINSGDLDVAAASTPLQLSHKLFAGFGYTGDVYNNYPMSVGIGGSYEFATSNADLENYAIWAKLSVSC